MPDTAIPRGYVISFDYGLRRIGVAVGQAATRTASSLETVRNNKEPDWDAIGRLLREWKPTVLVVGLPLGAGGEDSDMSRAARKFGNRLHGRFGIEVRYMDERLTSHAARSAFAELRSSGGLRRKHARQLDAAAARIILENWLQSLPEAD